MSLFIILFLGAIIAVCMKLFYAIKTGSPLKTKANEIIGTGLSATPMIFFAYFFAILLNFSSLEIDTASFSIYFFVLMYSLVVLAPVKFTLFLYGTFFFIVMTIMLGDGSVDYSGILLFFHSVTILIMIASIIIKLQQHKKYLQKEKELIEIESKYRPIEKKYWLKLVFLHLHNLAEQKPYDRCIENRKVLKKYLDCQEGCQMSTRFFDEIMQMGIEQKLIQKDNTVKLYDYLYSALKNAQINDEKKYNRFVYHYYTYRDVSPYLDTFFIDKQLFNNFMNENSRKSYSGIFQRTETKGSKTTYFPEYRLNLKKT